MTILTDDILQFISFVIFSNRRKERYETLRTLEPVVAILIWV